MRLITISNLPDWRQRRDLHKRHHQERIALTMNVPTVNEISAVSLSYKCTTHLGITTQTTSGPYPVCMSS